MNLWLVIPVKPFGEGKSRLSSALSPAKRAKLMQELLAGVLSQIGESGLLGGTVVISRDQTVLDVALDAGAHPLHESGGNLNAALEQARSILTEQGAEAMLVLPADLPLLKAEDILELYDLALSEIDVVIAPSHDGGTNALLLSPPHVIDFMFGPDSFRRHLSQVIAKDMRYAIYSSTTIDRDLDQPGDLELVDRG